MSKSQFKESHNEVDNQNLDETQYDMSIYSGRPPKTIQDGEYDSGERRNSRSTIFDKQDKRDIALKQEV